MEASSIELNTIRLLSDKEYRSMSASDFKEAMETPGRAGDMARDKYIRWAKIYCAKQIFAKTPNRESILEEVALRSIQAMYKGLESYDPSKGMAFSSYFTTRIRFCLNEYLRDYGLNKPYEKKKVSLEGSDVALEENEEVSKTEECESDIDIYEHVVGRRSLTVSDMSLNCDEDDIFSRQKEGIDVEITTERYAPKFSKDMIPYIVEYMGMLPPVKKRILMDAWGFSISPEESRYSEEDVKKNGYAKMLSKEFEREGIHKTPEAIKTMLRDILNHLACYLVKQTGISRSEILDNLHSFVTADKDGNPTKEKVRNLLLDLDASDLSDDEAAMLFLLFFR